MQKINAANWISAARSCSPTAAPCSQSFIAAMSERRSAGHNERAAPAVR